MPKLQNISKRQLLALKIIEAGNTEAVSLKDIAEKMSIKPPTAIEILRPLEAQGFVSRQSGKRILSDSGVSCLVEYRRRHRLLEILLADVVGDDMSHKAAAEIDLSLSKETADSVCAAMGHPEKCPHGEVISPCEGE